MNRPRFEVARPENTIYLPSDIQPEKKPKAEPRISDGLKVIPFSIAVDSDKPIVAYKFIKALQNYTAKDIFNLVKVDDVQAIFGSTEHPTVPTKDGHETKPIVIVDINRSDDIARRFGRGIQSLLRINQEPEYIHAANAKTDWHFIGFVEQIKHTPLGTELTVVVCKPKSELHFDDSRYTEDDHFVPVEYKGQNILRKVLITAGGDSVYLVEDDARELLKKKVAKEDNVEHENNQEPKESLYSKVRARIRTRWNSLKSVFEAKPAEGESLAKKVSYYLEDFPQEAELSHQFKTDIMDAKRAIAALILFEKAVRDAKRGITNKPSAFARSIYAKIIRRYEFLYENYQRLADGDNYLFSSTKYKVEDAQIQLQDHMRRLQRGTSDPDTAEHDLRNGRTYRACAEQLEQINLLWQTYDSEKKDALDIVSPLPDQEDASSDASNIQSETSERLPDPSTYNVDAGLGYEDVLPKIPTSQEIFKDEIAKLQAENQDVWSQVTATDYQGILEQLLEIRTTQEKLYFQETESKAEEYAGTKSYLANKSATETNIEYDESEEESTMGALRQKYLSEINKKIALQLELNNFRRRNILKGNPTSTFDNDYYQTRLGVPASNEKSDTLDEDTSTRNLQSDQN